MSQYVQTYATLCRNKVKAARGFLSAQRERRARVSERCSRCSSGAGARVRAALGQWVTPLPAPRRGRGSGGCRGRRAQCLPARSAARHARRARSARPRPLAPMPRAASASAPLTVSPWLQDADWLLCDHEEDQVAAGGCCAPHKGEFIFTIKLGKCEDGDFWAILFRQTGLEF